MSVNQWFDSEHVGLLNILSLDDVHVLKGCLRNYTFNACSLDACAVLVVTFAST